MTKTSEFNQTESSLNRAQISSLVKLLLVEDNPADARLVMEMLKEPHDYEYNVVHVELIADAVDALKENVFDLILLDLKLTGSSEGMVTFDRVSEQTRDVPIIVLTGLTDEKIAVEAVRRGAQDYLVKGEISSPKLFRSIHYALERHSRQMQLRSLDLDKFNGLYNSKGYLTPEDQKTRFSRVANVLIIEDNAEYADLLTSKLSESEYAILNVECSSLLTEGLRVLEIDEVDVILLDLQLPDSGGLETLLSIRKKHPRIPVVVLSAVSDETQAMKAVQMGAQDYLIKGEVTDNQILRSIYHAIERKRADEEIRRARESFRVLIEHTLDLIAILDIDGTFRYTSPSHKKVLGYESEELVGTRAFDLIHLEDFAKVMDAFYSGVSNSEDAQTIEYRFRHKDGTWVYLETTGKIVTYEEGEVVAILNSRDITERKRLEDQLRNLSITDELTGLYNRRGFLTLANQRLKSLRRAGKNFFLMYADVDNLKKINDTFGHSEGDKALVITARILKKTFRDSDVIARLGGDEFVIMVTSSKAGISKIISSRLSREVELCNKNENLPYKLSLSTGTISFDAVSDDPVNIEKLMDKADKILYEEKQKKRT